MTATYPLILAGYGHLTPDLGEEKGGLNGNIKTNKINLVLPFLPLHIPYILFQQYE